jgi:hypothetical protein
MTPRLSVEQDTARQRSSGVNHRNKRVIRRCINGVSWMIRPRMRGPKSRSRVTRTVDPKAGLMLMTQTLFVHSRAATTDFAPALLSSKVVSRRDGGFMGRGLSHSRMC